MQELEPPLCEKCNHHHLPDDEKTCAYNLCEHKDISPGRTPFHPDYCWDCGQEL